MRTRPKARPHSGPHDPTRARAGLGDTSGGRLFDQYATSYIDIVNAGLGVAGEDVLFFANLKAELVARELAGNSTDEVLDFGCGVGHGTVALATALPRARVTGCDPSQDSLREARGNPASRSTTNFVSFEGQRLPFRSAIFDVVFTSCVFHHIDRTRHAAWIAEIARVLRPGGAFFIFEHNPFNLLTRRSVARCPFDEGAVLLRPSYTCNILRAAGLVVAGPKFYFFFPHVLAALRRFERFLTWCPIGAQYYVCGRRP